MVTAQPGPRLNEDVFGLPPTGSADTIGVQQNASFWLDAGGDRQWDGTPAGATSTPSAIAPVHLSRARGTGLDISLTTHRVEAARVYDDRASRIGATLKREFTVALKPGSAI